MIGYFQYLVKSRYSTYLYEKKFRANSIDVILERHQEYLSRYISLHPEDKNIEVRAIIKHNKIVISEFTYRPTIR